MKQTSHKTLIGSFLIIGTLFLGPHHLDLQRWLDTENRFLVICADLPLLAIAGLTSTISFLRKGHIWKMIRSY